MEVDQVPAFNGGGVLPPYVSDAASAQGRSPYDVTMGFLIARFGTSEARLKLLRGLVEYRKALYDGGFRVGYQWLDGSFVENSEVTKGRPPGDIDVVTLFHRPLRYQTDPARWKAESSDLFRAYFSRQSCRTKYLCDIFPIDLDKPPFAIVNDVTYWFGLFSHQKVTSTWKGMLRIGLLEEEGDYTNELLLVKQAEATHA